MISRTLSSKPIYASLGCKELHTHKRQVLGVKFSNQGRKPSKRAQLVEALEAARTCPELDQSNWVSATVVAQRLNTHSSTITNLAFRGIIPFDRSMGERRYKFSDVITAIEVYNSTRPKGKKKILTKYFRGR